MMGNPRGNLSFSLYHQKRREGRLYSLLLRVVAVLLFHQLVVSGDIETNPGPRLADKPTMRQLIVLKKSDGSEGHLRIVDWISSLPRSKCNDFAHILLNNLIRVRSHRKQATCDDEFVRAVLEDWLSQPDRGSADEALPRTWEALADCVEDAGLDRALAEAIRDNCSIKATGGITDQAIHSQQDVVRPCLTKQYVGLANEQEYRHLQYHREYPLYSKPQFTYQNSQQDIANEQVLLELNQSSPEYHQVLTTFQRMWVKYKPVPPPDAIFKVFSSQLYRQFSQYKSRLSNQSIEQHFHGTILTCDLVANKQACQDKACGVCGISRCGFDTRKIGSNIARFKRFGHGIYLAPNSSKCHDYTQGTIAHRAMLLCEVLPGKKYIVTRDQPSLKCPPQGYDSVYGQKGGSLNYDEIVLYRHEPILPKYVIVYQKDGVGKIAQ